MATAATSPPLTDRILALSGRRRLFLAVAAAAILLLLFWAMRGGGEAVPAAPAPAAPVTAAQDLIDPRAIAEPSPPAPALPAIALNGVMSGAAILTIGDGAQRAVPLGREFLPGVILKSVGIRHAIITSGGADLRLELNRFGTSPVGPASVQIASASAPATVRAAASDHHRQTVQYRLGLQPVRSGGRIAGFAVKPGARLPQLEAAGIKAGDVLVTVNGSSFDEERMMELSWEIANSTRTEVEYIRGGRRLKAAL